jgi:hypothetical protein
VNFDPDPGFGCPNIEREASMKDFQAKEASRSPPKRTSSISTHEISSLFLCESHFFLPGFGSRDSMESGSYWESRSRFSSKYNWQKHLGIFFDILKNEDRHLRKEREVMMALRFLLITYETTYTSFIKDKNS